MEYNQQNQMLEEGSSREKLRRGRRSHEKRAFEDEELGFLGAPRKLGKKIIPIDVDSQILEYSNINLIPEIKLTLEQMKRDPIELIVELQKKYQIFGAVKLITPPEWRPPFCFTYGQIGITTRIQHLHKLKFGKAFKENEDAYNVRNFEAMAKAFEKQYKLKTNPKGKSEEQKLQSEYWALINNTYDGPSQWKYKTTVQYAADLPTNKLGSGFPLSPSHKSTDSNFDYYSSLYNLNNTYKSSNSILKIADKKKEFISGVTMPWVYMAMRFSTFCWHVEDLWLNSINYNHKGGTKTWYVIPRKYKEKFDKYVVKKTGREDLLDRITFMLDPLEIIKNGIPVYKAHQRQGEYICTFFKAYHAGFSHSFNIGQAVNFASPLSLAYIEQAKAFLEANKQKKPAVLSYDWLVYENKLSSDKGNNDMERLLGEKYQTMLQQECEWIRKIFEQFTVSSISQIDGSCKYDRNSCSRCRNYLYLSSFRCLDCHRNYCPLDFQNCCHGNYELLFREPNADRKWITTLVGKGKGSH